MDGKGKWRGNDNERAGRSSGEEVCGRDGGVEMDCVDGGDEMHNGEEAHRDDDKNTQLRTLSGLFVQLRGTSSRGSLTIEEDPTASPYSPKQSYDDQRRTRFFLKDQIPTWFAVGGYIIIAATSTAILPHMFHQLRWYYILVIYICAPVLAFCNAYGAGLTDWSLASTYGKLAIFTIGAWAGSEHGGMLAGLAACGVMMNIVSTASDLTQDFKTGYLALSSPRSMFISKVIGTAMGCVVSPWLFYNAFDDLGLPNSEYPAPFATVYRSMAKLGVEGVSSLPRECLVLCYAFFGVAILVNIVKDSLPSRWGRFVPLPMAMAIPFFLGPYFAIDIPPVCMKFLDAATNSKVDKFLHRP
ncbi:hypothetical protein HID58_053957 [Brassica napus]|uniref:Uncharacterized protein n=1 Tax=Brassica napus TaxID=3708 RepID=A0ABQ8AGF5_BRANA|nr:hypothetical protein HID58_053957 [Brassica napus]